MPAPRSTRPAPYAVLPRSAAPVTPRFGAPRAWLCGVALWLCAAGASASASPVWTNALGGPSAQARQAVQLLQNAAAEGLNPGDYQADTLAHALQQGAPVDMWAPQLTAALQHYLRDLRQGRVPPQQVQEHYRQPDTTELVLEQALASEHLQDLVRRTTPAMPQYRELRDALAHYRQLAQHPAWQQPLPPLPGRRLSPGAAWAGLPLLQQRLQALGDLPASVDPNAPAPTQYDATLRAGVEAFQSRHGLTPDGVIGAETLAALNVTPAQRAEQIALGMERLRWLPEPRGPRMVVVNLPEFVLRAYSLDQGRPQQALRMKVIVGKALKTSTPLFDEDMRFIEFSPYWNIPPSIARGETIPRLRRDPGYFQRQGLELVDRQGKVVPGFDATHLDAVLRGQMRIRQRPGPHNALGDIKFVFPNHNNIYLHHTPSTQLFERTRRDFSHGCIRIEDPHALAQFVLQDEPEWTPERIRSAMERGKSSTLRLKTPVPVVLAYHTTVVQDGKVHFLPDIYRRDPQLAQALQRHSQTQHASARLSSAQALRPGVVPE